MAADRTPNDVADALDRLADGAKLGLFPTQNYERGAGVLLNAAVLLRRQGEQLDTLRNAGSVRERAEQLARVCTDQQLVALMDLWANEMDRRKRAPRGSRIAPSALLAAAGGGVPEEGA